MARAKALKTLLILLCLCGSAFSGTSIAEKFLSKEVAGSGPLPYNYRVIDKNIHAGGHPLNPSTHFDNTDDQSQNILEYLKSQGVNTIIDLENTQSIQERYSRLLKSAGMTRLHIPMSASKTPNKKEWAAIKQAMHNPVYIHCTWGADRTGAIIGRYLVEEKGYSPEDAYNAVTSSGSHAGIIGGLKTGPHYKRLKDFIFQGSIPRE